MQAFSRRWMREAWTWVNQPTVVNPKHPHPPCVLFAWQKLQSVLEVARFVLRDLKSSCIHPSTCGLVTLAWVKNKTPGLQDLCYELPTSAWREDASCDKQCPDKKEQLSTLYADLISLFTLRQCILEEWWTACSAATLPLPSSPPTPLFKPGQLCTEGTNNSSGTGRQQRHQKEVADGTRGLGECSWHRRSEARQLLGPTPAICWCTQRALQREEWNPW